MKIQDLFDSWLYTAMLETLDYTIRIDSTPTFLYFDLYLSTLPTQLTTFISVLYIVAGKCEIACLKKLD